MIEPSVYLQIANDIDEAAGIIVWPQPIRWYKMKEKTGNTTADSGSQGIDATLDGSTRWGVFAGLPAVIFDGTSGCDISALDTGLPTGNNMFSVFANIQTSETPGSDFMLVSWGTNAAYQAVFFYIAADGTIKFGSPGGPEVIGSVVNDGLPHTVGVTWNGNVISIYVDSVLSVATIYNSLSISLNGVFAIGADNFDLSSQNYSGVINNVAVWDIVFKPQSVVSFSMNSAIYSALTAVKTTIDNIEIDAVLTTGSGIIQHIESLIDGLTANLPTTPLHLRNFVCKLQDHIARHAGSVDMYYEITGLTVKPNFAFLSELVGFPIDPIYVVP